MLLNNIIYLNKIPYDNTSKKVCPVCHKVYKDYPVKSHNQYICQDCYNFFNKWADFM